jgi:hypothetical protein
LAYTIVFQGNVSLTIARYLALPLLEMGKLGDEGKDGDQFFWAYGRRFHVYFPHLPA